MHSNQPANIGKIALQALIKQRRRARQARERRQLPLIIDSDLWHSQICDKIETLGLPDTELVKVKRITGEGEFTCRVELRRPFLENFLACGTNEIVRICKCCGARKTFAVNCNQKFCPRCQWRLTKKRVEIIQAWSARIKNPLHLVLTQKNFPVLTRKKICEHMRNLRRMRGQKLFAPVRGGSTSVEITNKGNGWHLHSHWLLDSDWIDPGKISVAWGKLVGQEFAIVKLKPITQSEYMGELAKYVAKGNEIASWSADEIWQFINAIRRQRFFFTFGTLRKLGPEIRAQLAFMKPEAEPCECGESDWKFQPAPLV
jgi:hypothetical protein